jgi:hypothetical protein
MKVRIWPEELFSLGRAARPVSRHRLIRRLLAAMRKVEVFGVGGSRFFQILECRPPLNIYAVSRAGFLYLPREWLPPGAIPRGLKIPVLHVVRPAEPDAWPESRTFIPAWLAYALATDATHSSRILAFVTIAAKYAEKLDPTEAAFSA